MEIDGYKLIKSKFGDRYYLNGRLVKFADVPEDIKEKLEAAQTNAILDPHVCIFCGEAATETRFINQQAIALCNDHYYSTSVGKIVGRLKEIYNENAKTTGSGNSESAGPKGDDRKLRKNRKGKGKRRSNRRAPKQTSEKTREENPVSQG